MKKCPYCSAEILEDAEFCLYCMRQLKEKTVLETKIKRQRTPIIIIAVLLALLVCVAIIIKPPSPSENHSSPDTDSPNISYEGLEESENSASNSDEKTQNENDKPTTPVNQWPTQATPTEKTDKNELTTNQNTTPEQNTDTDTDTDTDTEQPIITPPATSVPEDEQEQKEPPVWETRAVNGGVEITGIATKNSSGNYNLPAVIDDKTVVGIANLAFYYETSLKSITLPNTLKYIGEQSFAGCSSITSITIPSSVTSLGSNAFVPCSNLRDVYICSLDIQIPTTTFSTYYQRSVTLTIHAPASVMDSIKARVHWDAEYEEWNG